MKCFEIRECSDKERETCYVWNSLRENPQDMDSVRCWIMKEAYQQDNRRQLKECQACKYYLMMNRDTGVESNYDADLAIVNCDGVINNERTKALEKVWENLKAGNKMKVLLKIENVNNIYSCGLGVLIKIHKETAAAGGILIVQGAQGYVQGVFESTKLSRILNLSGDSNKTRELLDAFSRKTVISEGEKPAKPRKERPPCFVYWNNRNPRNATACDECFKKINPGDQPCWVVEGMIEGVSFQYVNEECEDCSYFLEYSSTS